MTTFNVGDKVLVDGQEGTVVEVAVHDAHHLRDHEQMYGVRLTPWPWDAEKKQYRNPVTGELRDHAADTLGSVMESQIEASV